ncbi:MAG TPA: L,D-transpeptidase family protein [Geminicoccaceae bacterium]|nr:L,D-transpeptidase family protein [Geminicoccaceae bacterium]
MTARRRPAVALCLAGVWFSGGCNIDHLTDAEGNLRETTSYRTSYEDTLLDVARRFNLGYVEMVAANPGTDPWIPGEGTDVVLPTVHLVPNVEPEGIVINLADMRLYFFEEPGAKPRSYPIGIGRDGLTTPTGVTEVVRKAKNPTWRPTARMRAEDPELPEVVPPGPDNPLGTRALYLGWPTYAIHGTNKPWGVGRRVSSGCIRMYPEHAEELYDLVEIGTKVTVVDQPIKLEWLDGELYMEAHPTQVQSDQLEAEGRFTPELPSRVVDQVLEVAGDQAARLDWSRVRRATVERRGYPIRITR